MVLAPDPVQARETWVPTDDGWTAAQAGRLADCDQRCVPRVMEDPLWHRRISLTLHHPGAHHDAGLVNRPRQILTNDVLRIDFIAGTLSIRTSAGHWVDAILPPKQHTLICYLGANVGRTIPHEELLSRIWDASYIDDPHVLRVTLSRARCTIEAINPAAAELIVTVKTCGYRMTDLRDADGNTT